MKHLFAALCLVVVGLSFAGCGEKKYDIPEVDPEEAAIHEEEINKQMEAEMERQMKGGGKKK